MSNKYDQYETTVFNYRSPIPGKNSIITPSFSFLHQSLLDAAFKPDHDKMYHKIEQDWKDQGFFDRTGRTFYASYESGIRSIKSRATKLRNAGYPLDTAGFGSSGKDMSKTEVCDMINYLKDLANTRAQLQSRTGRPPGVSAYTPNGF
jgi:hypothetical protein